MEYLTQILIVTGIHLLAVASPGPDFIVAVRNSLTYSRRTGIFTSIGFGLGISVHIAYCAAGVAVLISQSILLFNLLKFAGAAYLIYIGILSFRSRGQDMAIGEIEKENNDVSPLVAIKQGFLTNVLNPKATLFFLSLFTLVISPSTPLLVLVIMSVIMVLNTMLWFALVSIFLTQMHVRRAFTKFQSLFNKLFGAGLIGLGLKVGLSEK